VDSLSQVLAAIPPYSPLLRLRDYNGRSLVLTATREGHAAVVELLISHGADFTTPNNDGWSPLAFACRGEPKAPKHPPEWCQMVRALIAAGAPLEPVTSKGFTPLHYASASGNVEAMKTILQARGNALAQTKLGNSPLHFAAFLGHVECVRVLLEVPGTIEQTDKGGRTALHFASVRGLMEPGPKALREDVSCYKALHTDMQLLKANSLGDAHVRMPPRGSNIHLQVMKLLLEGGASVQPRTLAAEATALHLALFHAAYDEIKLLLASDEDTEDRLGKACHRMGILHLASCLPDANMLREVLEDPETDTAGVAWVDDEGRSSLHVAVRCGYADNVRELLRWNAPTYSIDQNAQTPVLIAASKRRVDILSILLEHRTQLAVAAGKPTTDLLGEVDDKGQNALHLALRGKKEDLGVSMLEAVEWLLSKGVNVNAADHHDMRPMHVSCTLSTNEAEKVVKRLLRANAEIDAIDIKGRTASHWAAIAGSERAMLELVELGSDIDLVDNDGNTMLHLAAQHGHEKIIRLMMQHAAVLKRNHHGFSPRDYAFREDIHDLLKVEELRQGFEIQWDYVFECCYSSLVSADFSLGPPKEEIVTSQSIKKELANRDATILKAHMAATSIQRQIRGKLTRRLRERRQATLVRQMSCVQHSRRHLNGSFKVFKQYILGVGEEHEQASCSEELKELLSTLRIHRIDYILIRPYNDDRLYIALSAALCTLQNWADRIGMRARLRHFQLPLERKLNAKSAEVPHARFTVKDADAFLPFRSSERIQLLTNLLQNKDHGCQVDFHRMLHREFLVDHFAVHHQHERRVLNGAWAAPRSAAPIWPPHLAELYASEERDRAAPGELALAGYMGEHSAFEVMYFAFYVLWLLMLVVPGILVYVWRIIIGIVFSEEDFFVMISHIEIAFSVYAIFCAFILRKFWRRRQLLLSKRWQIGGYSGQTEHLRPQFVGTLKVDIVTGETVLWSSRTRRHLKYVAGGLVTLGVMVVVIAIQMIPVLAQDYIQSVLPISDMIYNMCEALYTGFTIEIVGGMYRKIAVRLTTWENHRTVLAFKQSGNLKVFTFMCAQCYFSVVYMAFFDPERFEKPHETYLGEISTQVSGLMITRTMSHLMGGVMLPYSLGQTKYHQLKEVRKTLVQQTSHVADGIPRSEEAEDSIPIRAVLADAELRRPDHQLGFDADMALFALHYGFVTCFAPVSPTLPLLALILGLVLIRSTIFRALFVQRREIPLPSNGLGVWLRLLDALTFAAVITNSLFITFIVTGHSQANGMDNDDEPAALNETSSAMTNATACDVEAPSDDAFTVIILVMCFLGLYILISQISDSPSWLKVHERRLKHFDAELAEKTAARHLAAAIAQERFNEKADRTRFCREWALDLFCAAPNVVMRWLAYQPHRYVPRNSGRFFDRATRQRAGCEEEEVPYFISQNDTDDFNYQSSDSQSRNLKIGTAVASLCACLVELF